MQPSRGNSTFYECIQPHDTGHGTSQWLGQPLTEAVHGYMLLFGVFFLLLLCSLLPRICSLAQGFPVNLVVADASNQLLEINQITAYSTGFCCSPSRI